MSIRSKLINVQHMYDNIYEVRYSVGLKIETGRLIDLSEDGINPIWKASPEVPKTVLCTLRRRLSHDTEILVQIGTLDESWADSYVTAQPSKKGHHKIIMMEFM